MFAVAWNLVREALRKRSAVLFFLLVAGSGLVLPLAMEGDGTLLGRLQLAVVYGMGVPCFLIAVATVAAAAGALSRELELSTIQLLAARPVRRWEIVLGKLLGLCLLDLGLLLTVSSTFAVDLSVLQGRDERPPGERQAAEQRFLSPRIEVFPQAPIVDEERLRQEVDRRLAAAAADPHPLSRAQIEANLRRAVRMKRAAPGEAVELDFRGLDGLKAAQGAAGSAYLRYELLALSPEPLPQVEARWEVLPPEPGTLPGGALQTHVVEERARQGVPREFAFPASLVSPEGVLRVRVTNREPPDSNVTLFVDLEKVKLLIAHGRFWPNVASALLLMFSALVLLSSITLAAGVLFTFPTASLLGYFVYFSGLAAGFLRQTFGRRLAQEAAGSFKDLLDKGFSRFGQVVLDLLPDFTSLDPLGRLARGLSITPLELARGAGWMVGMQAGVALLIAMGCFWRRELARGDRY